MKKKILPGVLALLLVFSACKPDELMTFEGVDYIVFRYGVAILEGPPMPGVADEHRFTRIEMNLANVFDQTEVRVGILVQIIGSVADFDRPIPFRLNPGSTTISGDIVLLPSYVRAGRTIDTLWVQVNESASLREGRIFTAIIDLHDSEFFKSDFRFGTNDFIDGVRQYGTANDFTIEVSYDAEFPNIWSELIPMPGNPLNMIFHLADNPSEIPPARCHRRFSLMQEVSGFSMEEFRALMSYDPLDFPALNPPPPIAASMANGSWDMIPLWGRMISVYLRERAAAIDTVRDVSGVPIVLGPNFANI